MVTELARRDFRARYAGSALGIAWAVLEPAIYFGLYLLVFGKLLGMRVAADMPVQRFSFYLLGGLVPFLAFQELVTRSASMARSSAQLIRHASVPLEVVVAGSFAATLARHAIGLGIVLGAAVAFGEINLAGLPLLLAGAVLLVVGAWGVALALVPAGAYLPDLAPLVGSATTVLLFLTPVVYPLELVPEAARRWMAANPLFGVLALFRAAFSGGPVAAGSVAVSAAAALAALGGGLWLFARRSRQVPDVV